ncbi:FCD domain-containing protein [Phyllobacterium sp. 21LDTY02-6]|uniref:FadR/GntR family transcriptional regulator n=1 Tax=Phyllobacterium sp. 21LDTY02-6 TaxID=2944903 RepID=UPI00201FC56C|nr:FCD domain-containing protein [Phyllobacterium sp. 21LDTY02-6]MCO4319102.1 FCD domain-containing protein [Phyllobacterium sp. 21LDTY02-6]
MRLDDLLSHAAGPELRTAAVTAKRELADRIITAIVIGAYSPGEQLPSERELADLQKVSRVTVRGALELVREKGLLTSKRGRGGGTFVKAVNLKTAAPDSVRKLLTDELPQLTEFVDFRCLIAGLEARTAAERHRQEQSDELREILNDFCATDDLAQARVLDRRLHQQISKMAGNPQLESLVNQLSIKATLGFNSEPYPLAYLDQARTEHIELVDAIVTRDLARSYSVAYKHFSLTLKIMIDVLELITSS